MPKWFKFVLRCIIVLSIFVSCDIFKMNIIVDFDYNLFLTRKTNWKTSKQSNYQYTLIKDGNGFADYVDALVIVENGQYKEQFSNIEYGGTVDINYQTIDNIYETIENIYNEYNDTQRSKNEVYLKKINVGYDSANNIPIKIEYYYYVPGNVADAGDYWVYKIKDYKKNGL